ncbi:hypothetical protein [Alteribacter aurantiacus]|uniref:hypothetical protein n=1 Tax=Alteribacter aurantiacus TaxID=254410 RepID=UPI00040962B2|nr:hypothetical protein [Alteribacter aurantiacus]
MSKKNTIFTFILLLAIITTGTVVTANVDKNDNAWYVELGNMVSKSKVNVSSIDEWSPINSEFDYNRHDQFIITLVEYVGMDKDEAIHEAVEGQIINVALLQKAIESGIEISKEDALREAQIDRSIMEDGDADNAQEALETIRSFIKGLGITEEQYWTEYVVPQYQEKLMLLELQDQVLGSSSYSIDEDTMDTWARYEQNVVDEFVRNNKQEVLQFKSYATE